MVRCWLQCARVAEVLWPWDRLASDWHVVKRHEVAEVLFKIASVPLVFHLPRDVCGRLNLLHDRLLIVSADSAHSLERICEVAGSCSLAIHGSRCSTPSWRNQWRCIAALELDAELVDAATVQPRDLRQHIQDLLVVAWQVTYRIR